MVDPKIEFEALPEWLQSAWKLAPEIARKAEAELAALRSRVAELEAAQAETLTPRKCVTCTKLAEQMRESAAKFADDFDGEDLGFDVPTSIGAGIRALPLPTCGDCNPLAPSWDCQHCENRQIGGAFSECPNCGNSR